MADPAESPAYVEALLAEGAAQNAAELAAQKARNDEMDRYAHGVAAIVSAINPVAGAVVAKAWAFFTAAGRIFSDDFNSEKHQNRARAAIPRWFEYGRPAFLFLGDVDTWDNYASNLEAGIAALDALPTPQRAACKRLGARLLNGPLTPTALAAISNRELYKRHLIGAIPLLPGPDGTLPRNADGSLNLFENVVLDDGRGTRRVRYYTGPQEPMLAAELAAADAGVSPGPVQRAAIAEWIRVEAGRDFFGNELIDYNAFARRWGAIALAAVTAADEAKPTRAERRLNLRQFRAVASPSVEPGGGSTASTSPQLALRGQTTPAATTEATSSVSQPSGSLSTGAKVAIVAGGGLGVVALVVASRRLGWF